MFQVLGWVNVALLVILYIPYVGTRMNRLWFGGKNESLKSIVRTLRMLHKPAGFALVLVALYHGYLALGRVMLHTGTVLFVFAAITATLGFAFWRIKDKKIFQSHKFFALITGVLFLLHWLAPGALRGLM